MTNEELVALIQAGVDVQENMAQLYQQNQRFIIELAMPFTKSCELEDLVQEAYFGLEQAVQKFEPDQGFKFLTFASYDIRRAIQRYCQNNGNLKRIPVHVLERISKYQRFRDDYRMSVGEEPSDMQYCSFLGIKKPQLKELRKFIGESTTASLEDVAPGTDDFTLADTIADNFNLEETVLDSVAEEHAKTLIQEAIAALPDTRSAEVIKGSYWENKTLQEVGERLSISRTRAEQLRGRALQRLKADRRIKEAAEIYGYNSGRAYHWGVNRWKNTGYSSTEFLAIKHIEQAEAQKRHLQEAHELTKSIPMIADGIRKNNDGYTPCGIRKLEELSAEVERIIQNRLTERKKAANG